MNQKKREEIVKNTRLQISQFQGLARMSKLEVKNHSGVDWSDDKTINSIRKSFNSFVETKKNFEIVQSACVCVDEEIMHESIYWWQSKAIMNVYHKTKKNKRDSLHIFVSDEEFGSFGGKN